MFHQRVKLGRGRVSKVSKSERRSVIGAQGVVAPLRNHNASEATGVDNRGLISQFRPSLKYTGGMGEMYDWILQANLLYTFDGTSSLWRPGD